MSPNAKNDLPAFFFKFFFGSLRTSGNLWKILEIVAKCLKQPSSILNFFLNLQKLLEVFRKNRKMLESSQNDLPTLFENFWKSSEVFGNARKTSETL